MIDHHDTLFQSLNQTLKQAVGEDRLAKLQTVLEFGCGKTGYVHKYKQTNMRAFGVDLADLEAFWSPRDVEYIQSDGATIDIPDNFIDLLVSHSVVEHVEDLPGSMKEINRIVKPGGLIYITVSPLYFSPTGSHIKTLPDWEHLKPGSAYYLITTPIEREGAFLNQLTVSEFLSYVGDLPWDINRFERKSLSMILPDWLSKIEYTPLDLLTKEFRLVATKK